MFQRGGVFGELGGRGKGVGVFGRVWDVWEVQCLEVWGVTSLGSWEGVEGVWRVGGSGEWVGGLGCLRGVVFGGMKSCGVRASSS